VVKQCVGTEGVEPDYIRTEVLPEFFRCLLLCWCCLLMLGTAECSRAGGRSAHSKQIGT